jgi:hypothetical protein
MVLKKALLSSARALHKNIFKTKYWNNMLFLLIPLEASLSDNLYDIIFVLRKKNEAIKKNKITFPLLTLS